MNIPPPQLFSEYSRETYIREKQLKMIYKQKWRHCTHQEMKLRRWQMNDEKWPEIDCVDMQRNGALLSKGYSENTQRKNPSP